VALNVSEPARLSTYVWGVVEAAITRIETAEADPATETAATLSFIRGGLDRA
jgi:hypothetical protein